MQHDIREAERREIVATNLQLSSEEPEKFSPLYDAYLTKIKDQEKAAKIYFAGYQNLWQYSSAAAESMVIEVQEE